MQQKLSFVRNKMHEAHTTHTEDLFQGAAALCIILVGKKLYIRPELICKESIELMFHSGQKIEPKSNLTENL